MGLHGVTTVVFRLTPAGHLLWAKVEKSSGVPPIDNAALARVKATLYPAFPAALPQHDTTFEIAVKLSTDRS
jgi:periplasmic protein TonB